jgi:TolB-like protein
MSGSFNLFGELKRRNVFRVPLFYIVSAWVVVQVAETVLPMFDVPDGALRAVVVILVIGFPLALAFAWIFELTNDGLKLDRNAQADPETKRETSNKLNWATLVAAVLAIGLLAADRMIPERTAVAVPSASIEPADDSARTAADPNDSPSARAPDLASIAVLPFADLSPQGDQAYFCDGIAEEIMNVLSRIEQLVVTSRTSAFAFRSRAGMNVRDIADALGVRHVLEGSVRKAADTIRVSAQLIDARSDQQLWSETFDRQLTAENVFAIQEEIAAAITGALAGRLDVPIPSAPSVAGGTADLDAYEAFLAGRDLFINRNYDNLQRSIALLEQAVEADPGFTRATGWLALAYAVAPAWGFADRDYFALTTDAAHSVLAADPDNAAALTALGNIQDDRAVEIDFLQRALAADPSKTTAHLWLAQEWRTLGFFDRATRAVERCLEVDPQYPVCIYTHAEIAAIQGRYDEAVERLMPIFETAHEESYPLFLGITARNGDTVLLTLMLRELADTVGPGARWIVADLRRALSDEDYDREAALARFEARLRAEFPDSHGAEDPYLVAAYRLAFRAYARVPTTADIVPWWWAKGHPGLAESEHRYRAMKDAGLSAYWRDHGFPPLCRPLGENDFECD